MHIEDKKVLLRNLGADNVVIVNQLKLRGIKGRMAIARSCPIANYIKSIDPNAVVSVSSEEILWDADSFSTPKPLVEFIRYFDRGYIVDLIERD